MKVRYLKDKEKFIITESERHEYHQTKMLLTRKMKGFFFDPRFKAGIWDGDVTYFKDGSFDFGLYREVSEMCKQNGWKFVLENKEDFPTNNKITLQDVQDFCDSFFKDRTLKDGKTPFIPKDYQITAAFQILKNRYCLIEIGTGGGKSLVFAIVAFYLMHKVKPENLNKLKMLLLVPSISLVTQFYDDLINYNKGFHNENLNPIDLRMCEMMSEKPRRDEGECNIFIGTYASVEKRDAEFFEQFKVVATDECHSASHGKSSSTEKKSGFKMIKKIIEQTRQHAYFRFGMSGTYPRTDTLDWLSVVSLHGPLVSITEAQDLIKNNHIADVKIKAVMLNHNDPEFDQSLALIRRGNGKGAFDIEKRYIHESVARLDFIVDKIIASSKKNALVLFNSIEYGTKIYNAIRDRVPGVDVYYIDGTVKKDKREMIKRKLEGSDLLEIINHLLDIKTRPRVLVASFGTLSTGVSINNLHIGVFAEGYKSEQIMIQSVGRFLRKHKDKDRAIIFDIIDILDEKSSNKNSLLKHYHERKEFYNNRGYTLEEIKMNIKKR
jgi:superfamily II DNA or RNA helicase